MSASPLAVSLFPVFEEAPRTVHGDGYVELKRAYYSVPPEYVGRQVWVRWESRLLWVINQRREVIAVHALVKPGKFTIDPTKLHSPSPPGLSVKGWHDRRTGALAVATCF